MRRMLALAALTLAMMGIAGLPTCDSGCVASAEDGRPAVDSSRPQAVPAGGARGRVREPVDYIYPPPLGEEQRGSLRGDFWTPAEFDRTFPDTGAGFETIVPVR